MTTTEQHIITGGTPDTLARPEALGVSDEALLDTARNFDGSPHLLQDSPGQIDCKPQVSPPDYAGQFAVRAELGMLQEEAPAEVDPDSDLTYVTKTWVPTAAELAAQPTQQDAIDAWTGLLVGAAQHKQATGSNAELLLDDAANANQAHAQRVIAASRALGALADAADSEKTSHYRSVQDAVGAVRAADPAALKIARQARIWQAANVVTDVTGKGRPEKDIIDQLLAEVEDTALAAIPDRQAPRQVLYAQGEAYLKEVERIRNQTGRLSYGPLTKAKAGSASYSDDEY